MIRRMLGMLAVIAIGLSGATASAHRDYTSDGNRGTGTDNNNIKRCDTYYRAGHAKDAQGDPDRKDMNGDGIPDANPAFDPDTGHSEDHVDSNDEGDVGRRLQKEGVPVGADSGVYVHSHTGHYVVRHDAFYVEVIGGGGYNRGGNQGGVVQGEVDPGSGAPDADFNVGTFAGTNGDMHSEHVCVAAAGQDQIGSEGEQP